jgi:ABC-type lipoprotein export system ATPase subunit
VPVVLTDITVAFGDRVVLDALSCSFADASVSAVLGPSGAGKSTLLAVVAGSQRVVGGTVVGTTGRRIAHIPQNPMVLPARTALDNIALGGLAIGWSAARSRSRAADLMERFGMSSLAGQRTYHLSGGERQRVTIMRALANQASIVLADEPTASLDAENRRTVVDALKTAAGSGTTVIVSTHDPYVAERADTILRLLG